ncbi:GOLPH3/VPS74 family protein [Saccharopolyspora rosea]|uniref:GPP34 family phosphoprotein n=1 Tax=Saccharopolyspora rosea TaxID=524884 RepID=A0ABW3FPZ0_9PSEU|nr:GPP34 family phosphoprotein [Saccharopolyspora rosea]
MTSGRNPADRDRGTPLGGRHPGRHPTPAPPRAATTGPIRQTDDAPATVDTLLADDFFFTAHDDVSGRPRLSPGATRLGLAGALLGELVLFGRITVAESEGIAVHDDRPPPDALAHAVLDQIVRDGGSTSLRDWLVFLSRTSYEWIGQRLERTGQALATSARRLLRRTTVYVPVDANAAVWPAVRITNALRRDLRLSTPDLALGGLVVATGLERAVFQDIAPTVTRSPHQLLTGLHQLLTNLPPPLRALLVETEAAIGDAVLTHRS